MSFRDLRPPYIPPADDCMDVVAELLDTPVIVTEKVIGRPVIVTAHFDDQRRVQVTYARQEGDPEVYDQLDNSCVVGSRVNFFLRAMASRVGPDANAVTLYGVYSLQGEGIYEEMFLYDIEIDGEPLGAYQAFALFDAFSMLHVPRLTQPGSTLRRWLGRRSIQVAAKGPSRLYAGPRAGIIVRPEEELSSPVVGRVIFQA